MHFITNLLFIICFFVSVFGKAYSMTVVQDSLMVENPDTLKRHKYSWSAHIMGFGRFTGYVDNIGSVNPANRVAKIDRNQLGLYFRPEFKYETNSLGIWIKPRLNIHYNLKSPDKEENYDYDLFFQQLKAKWQITESLSIMGGRYLKSMGTSIFLNPSNPFFINPGRLNPKIEIAPMDFVEVDYSTQSSWNFSLIANVYDANNFIYNKPFFEFNRSYALLTEYFGDSENFGLVISLDESKRYHFGGYGQKNVNDAILVWTDFALDYNINRFYPVEGHHTGLLNYEMVNGEKNKEVYATGIVGGSYTFSFGPTFQLEYFYNGRGYTDKEFDSYNEMVKTSVNYNFEVTRQLSDLNLGRSINSGMPFIRKNYLFSQISQTDLFERVNCNFRYLYSIDDKSSQFSTLVEWDVLNNLEAYLVYLKNYGNQQTDLKRLINYQLMVGLIYKL